MSAPHDDRDPQMAALLRANADAPPLRPGFHAELEARLEAAGSPGAALTTVPARRRSVTARRLLAAAAVAAAAAVFALVVLPALRGTETATAGDVLAAMTASSGGAQTVRMHVVSKTSAAMGKGVTEPNYRETVTADLTLSITGDRLADLSSTWSSKDDKGVWHSNAHRETTAYDERVHEARSLPGDAAWHNGTVIRRPAWETDWVSIGGFSETYSNLSARLHAALAETDPALPVEQVSYLGRPAWHGVFTVRELWGPDADVPVAFHWDAAVDQETGLLVAASCTMEVKGKAIPWAWDLDVTSLELDPQLKPDWQRPAATTSKVTYIDEGTRFGTPEQVAKRSWPTLPLVPQWAPPGYRLADMASAGSYPGYLPWSAGQGENRTLRRHGDVTIKRTDWLLEGQTVLIRFRRGFSSFVVGIAPKGLGETITTKPDVTLTAGYLKGQPADFDAVGGAHSNGTGIEAPTLTTYSERSKIVITGDLTRKELVAVANSMKAYGDVDRPIMPGDGL